MSETNQTPEPWVDVVFDGPPDHNAPCFIEVEDGHGRSISAGEWLKRDDGNWALRFRKQTPAFTAMLAALHEVSDYLDGLVDVVDGPEGEQLPNKAMSLKQEVDEAIARAEGKR